MSNEQMNNENEVQMVKMAVNQEVCIGAGQCEMLEEETFLVDDDTVIADVIGTGVLPIDRAKRVIDACPTRAISIEEPAEQEVCSRVAVVKEQSGHSWREAGSGDETIVFLHPIVGSSVYWTPQLEALSDQWRCVAWDAPGYGQTAMVGEPLAASVTNHLLDFFATAGIGRAHVVGLSLGAMIALHAAGEHHERFDRLVLADTSAAFGIDPDEWLNDWLGDLRAGTPLTEVVDTSIGAITALAPEAGLRSNVVASFADVSNEAFETASRYIAGHNVTEALGAIANETLVVVGEHDGETPPEYGKEIATLLPQARFHEIPGAGHLTSIEAPEVFTGLIRSFLAGE